MSELSVNNAYEPTEAMLPTTPLSQHSSELSPNPQQYLLPSPKRTSLLTPPSSTTRFDTVSPQPSYYSASDIPPPSPLPPTQYRLASGEITTTPPPPSRRQSLATHASPIPSPPPPPPPIIQPPSHALLQPPTSQGPTGLMRRLSGGSLRSVSGKDEGMYEMRVRNPPDQIHDQAQQYGHGYGGRSESATSYNSFASSYATAADDFWASEDEGQGGYGSGSGGQQHRLSQGDHHVHERSSEETARARESYDRDTIMGVAVGQQHDRQTSAVSVETWEMGRAM